MAEGILKQRRRPYYYGGLPEIFDYLEELFLDLIRKATVLPLHPLVLLLP